MSFVKVMKYQTPPNDLILKGPQMSLWIKFSAPSIHLLGTLGNVFMVYFPFKHTSRINLIFRNFGILRDLFYKWTNVGLQNQGAPAYMESFYLLFISSWTSFIQGRRGCSNHNLFSYFFMEINFLSNRSLIHPNLPSYFSFKYPNSYYSP